VITQWAISLRQLLPEERRPASVQHNRPVAAWVGFVAALAVSLAAVTVRAGSDPLTLVIGALVLTLVSYCGVRMTGGVEILWTAGAYIHLALTYTFGPIGAVVGAAAQTVANAARMKNPPIRVIFNASNFFLASLCAWGTFVGLTRAVPGVFFGAFAATAGAVVSCLVNYALLAIVIHLASHGQASALTVFRRSFSSAILYNIGYGWAAYGAVLLHQVAGAVGFTTTLLPIVVLQGFLLLLARRIKAQEKEREEHAKEREALLQQAIDASDAERKRIASDLHDGVVQRLAGLALSLAARGSSKVADPHLLEAAATLRSSVTDLRTLMIEIAPPDLAESGVDGALRKLLEPLPARGIEVEFDSAEETHLSADKTSLVFRVAQEAIRNVVNHSEATKVIAKLHFVDGMVTLQVDDNGKGFSAADRSRRREEGHVGLHLLNNAVEASSGRLSLTSEPGHGTSLMLQLPC
jgi:signal transduction histidine kinase